MTEKQNRVAIIGCGNIDAANVYSLLAGGFVEELILVDDDKLAGEVAGLRRALPLPHPASVRKGDYKDAAQAEIVVIAAGAEAKPNESSLDLFFQNAVIVREISAQLKRGGFGGIILIITNPVDILAQIAQSESGLPANRVIGSGIGLEMSRPPAPPEEKPEVKTRSVPLLLPVLGETAETATWCAAMTGGEPLVDFCTPDCPDFGKMLEALRHSAPPAEGSKRIPFSAGTCVNRLCEAILGDEREILPVSAMTGGQYGVSGVYMNLPCVVGRRGVEKIVEFPLDAREKRALLDSAATLHKTYKSLKMDNKCSTATAR